MCEDAARALEEYGPEVAAVLWLRLADLRAASHPLELPFATAHPGADGAPPHIIVELAAKYCLVIAANHRRTPLASDGSVAWEHVSRVLILRVDYPRG